MDITEDTIKNKKFLLTLFLELIVILSLALAYFFIDVKDIYNFFAGNVKYTISNCDLQKEECRVVLSDGSEIEFSITPKEIPLLKPIEFNLKTKGIDSDEVEFRIFGKNMDMGVYSFKLKKVTNGEYKGRGLIPSCVIDMKWQGDLIIEKPTEKIGASFEFETKI